LLLIQNRITIYHEIILFPHLKMMQRLEKLIDNVQGHHYIMMLRKSLRYVSYLDLSGLKTADTCKTGVGPSGPEYLRCFRGANKSVSRRVYLVFAPFPCLLSRSLSERGSPWNGLCIWECRLAARKAGPPSGSTAKRCNCEACVPLCGTASRLLKPCSG
jgi:hypothetical protein